MYVPNLFELIYCFVYIKWYIQVKNHFPVIYVPRNLIQVPNWLFIKECILEINRLVAIFVIWGLLKIAIWRNIENHILGEQFEIPCIWDGSTVPISPSLLSLGRRQRWYGHWQGYGRNLNCSLFIDRDLVFFYKFLRGLILFGANFWGLDKRLDSFKARILESAIYNFSYASIWCRVNYLLPFGLWQRLGQFRSVYRIWLTIGYLILPHFCLKTLNHFCIVYYGIVLF